MALGKKYRDMTKEEQRKHLRAVADWAKRNPNATREIQKRYRLKNPFNAARHRLTRYGVTPQQFDQMLAEQNGRCGICGVAESGARDWHLDHDHGTGLPRGILCVRCNGGLGQFADNPVILQSAISYLKKATLKSLL